MKDFVQSAAHMDHAPEQSTLGKVGGGGGGGGSGQPSLASKLGGGVQLERAPLAALQLAPPLAAGTDTENVIEQSGPQSDHAPTHATGTAATQPPSP
jgi:hypothetical protein